MRPPLPPGSWGKVAVAEIDGGYRARARYRDHDGHTRQVEARGPSKGAAERALRAKMSTRATPRGSDLTLDSRLSALAELYFAEIEHDPDISKQTRYQYLESWERYTKPALGELRLREITTARCNAFLVSLADRGSTQAKLRSQLSGMLATGVRLDLFVANPIRSVKTPIRRSTPRAMSLDQVRELRERVMAYDATRRGAAPMLLDFVDLMFATGKRISEIAPLQWDDVDYDTRTITIARHSVRVKGSVAELAARATKTRTEGHGVVVPGFAITTLLARQAHPSAHPVWVFPSRKSGSFISPGELAKKLRGARGEDFDWVTSHTFRRTVATLIAAEADALSAAGQLDHSNVMTTKRHYIERALVAPDLSDILELLA